MPSNKIPSEREIELLALVITKRSGREVAKKYFESTGKKIPYGTVYTVFAQMEARKWVKIEQCTEGDRRVRRIEIAKGGIAALAAARKHHARLAELAAIPLSGNACSRGMEWRGAC